MEDLERWSILRLFVGLKGKETFMIYERLEPLASNGMDLSIIARGVQLVHLMYMTRFDHQYNIYVCPIGIDEMQ